MSRSLRRRDSIETSTLVKSGFFLYNLILFRYERSAIFHNSFIKIVRSCDACNQDGIYVYILPSLIHSTCVIELQYAPGCLQHKQNILQVALVAMLFITELKAQNHAALTLGEMMSIVRAVALSFFACGGGCIFIYSSSA